MDEAKALRFTQLKKSRLREVEPAMSLSVDRFRKIESIFHEALAVASEARSARVAELCDGDVALEAEVMALLQANSEEERMRREICDPEKRGDPLP